MLKNRTLKIAAIAAGGLVVALALLYVGLMHTGAGRRLIVTALTPLLERELGGPVTIGGTGGSWPGHMILRDVTIADETGVWIEAREVSARWNPWAAITGDIRIGDARIAGGTLYRLPERSDAEDDGGKLPRLPRLPNLRIGAARVTDFTLAEQVAGRNAVLTVTGAYDSAGRDHVRLDLNAATDVDGGDRVALKLHWLPTESRLTAEADIRGAPGGLLAQLIGAGDGPVALTLTGRGPAAGWTGTADASLGGMGTAHVALACDCLKQPRLTLDITARPGAALDDELRRWLGREARLAVTLHSQAEKSLTADIGTLDIAGGRLAAPASITLHEIGNRLAFETKGALARGPVLDDMLPPWLGKDIAWTAAGAFAEPGGFVLTAAGLRTAALEVTLEDARAVSGRPLHGNVRARLKVTDDLPESLRTVAGKDAVLSFTLAGLRDERMEAKDLTLTTATGLAAGGTVVYAPASRDLTARLTMHLPAPLLAALTGLPEPADPAAAELTLDGPVTDNTAVLILRTPALDAGAPLDPATWKLALEDALEDFSGTLTVRTDKDGPPLLSAKLAWPQRLTLQVRDVALRHRAMTLDGAVAFTPATGALVADGKLTADDLSQINPEWAGALAATIKLGSESGAPRLTLDASSEALTIGTLRMETVSAAARGPLDALTVSAAAALLDAPTLGSVRDIAVDAAMEPGGNGRTITVSKLNAILNGETLALRAPARVSLEDGSAALAETSFQWGSKGRLTVSGQRAPGRLALSVDADKAILPGLATLATGTVRIDTDAERPGAVKLRLDPREGPEVFAEIAGAWDGTTVDVTGTVQGYGPRAALKRTEILNASLPLRVIRQQDGLAFDAGGRAAARLAYQGRIGPLTAIVLDKDERVVNGDLTADLTMDGTLAAPRLTGSVTLKQGRYENIDAGLVLSDIAAAAEFSGGLEALAGTVTFSAGDGRDIKNGKPPIRGEGKVFMGEERPQIDATVKLAEARLLRRGDADATLSGALRLAGEALNPVLSGKLRVDKFDMMIAENPAADVVDVPVVFVDNKGNVVGRPNGKHAKAEAADSFNMGLDLAVRSDGRAFVRGRGLDSEWTAALTVKGTPDDPLLNGDLTLKQGKLNFGGRAFNLTQGAVSFTGKSPPDPVLNVTAEHQTEDGTAAQVRITGRASNPTVALESQPSLPKEDIMALVLFGKPARELTAFEALQTTNALAQLTGTSPLGGGSLLNRARRTLGLDLLELTYKGGEDVGLTVGRYVRKGVFVSATQDIAGESGSVSVEVDITKSLSIKTDVGQDAQGKVSAQWKKDY